MLLEQYVHQKLHEYERAEFRKQSRRAIRIGDRSTEDHLPEYVIMSSSWLVALRRLYRWTIKQR